MSPNDALQTLHTLRRAAGTAATTGLPDEVIARFAERDPLLPRAIAEAAVRADELRSIWGDDVFQRPERELAGWLQEDIVNFYPDHAVNPYIPLAARGPWIVTTHGAVLHDSGGYGMLGFGHGPDEVIATLSRPWVIANVMTASFSHRRLTDRLQLELGHTRPNGSPFHRFLFMNSGSESVTVAARIADIRAKGLTDPGGRHHGRRVHFLALQGGFHGRTDRPAQASSSSNRTYKRTLRSFRDRDNLWTVPVNDVDALRETFAAADDEGVYFDLMLLEPVMGEGRPGVALTREFYDEARRLCTQMGTFLLVDSIQAGLRAHGVLSLVDYPGFQDAEPPDMETWSKAINAAQYPLSVLGMTEEAANTYVRGVYGNTMTGNPRGVEVGATVLEMVTPEIRRNIVERGAELKARLLALRAELPDVIVGVTGTGLLLAADIDGERFQVTGYGGLEEQCRMRGIGVIHGGANALRFTPHFRITSAEIDLLISVLRDVLREASQSIAAK